MDIQKERKAFEAWAKISIENFVDLEHYGKFYVVQENSRLTIRKREFLLLAANRGWKAWRERAKAQAPEGFVLVPKEPTQDMMIAALAVISTGIGKDHIDVEIIQCWKKMIEAQEQSHD